MDKNEFLAVEVMQFEPSKHKNDKVFYIGNREHNGMWSDDWNPFENIEQAIDLLETFTLYSISKARNEYECTAFKEPGVWFTTYGKTVCEAICEAVLQTRGYNDD